MKMLHWPLLWAGGPAAALESWSLQVVVMGVVFGAASTALTAGEKPWDQGSSSLHSGHDPNNESRPEKNGWLALKKNLD